MDTAEDDDVGVGVFRVISEAERIADVVRDILNISGLVVMGEDNGVAFLFQSKDFLFQIECGHGNSRFEI